MRFMGPGVELLSFNVCITRFISRCYIKEHDNEVSPEEPC